jgi:phage terminase Nu1 subunit (DNA packaging protein)
LTNQQTDSGQKTALDEIWPEAELLQLLGLTKLQLADLRERGLPYFEANRTTRLYDLQAVAEYIRDHQTRRAGRQREAAND